MTTEAEARARLLAYYEDRLILLAGRVAALEAFPGSPDANRARSVANELKRTRSEIDDVNEKARRLRESIGTP